MNTALLQRKFNGFQNIIILNNCTKKQVHSRLFIVISRAFFMTVRNGTSTSTICLQNTTTINNNKKRNCGQTAAVLVYLHMKFNTGLFDARRVYFR
jgi:hypothetical protein